jgi:hypothetical protein
MLLMKRLRALRKKDKDAVVVNEAILATATSHQAEALAALEQAEVQAAKLAGMDARNHYSESMTYAFRGRTV